MLTFELMRSRQNVSGRGDPPAHAVGPPVLERQLGDAAVLTDHSDDAARDARLVPHAEELPTVVVVPRLIVARAEIL